MPFFLAAIPAILKIGQKVVKAVKTAKVVTAAAKAAKAAKGIIGAAKKVSGVMGAARASGPAPEQSPPLYGNLGAAINGGQLSGVEVHAKRVSDDQAGDQLKKYAPLALAAVGGLVVLKMVMD